MNNKSNTDGSLRELRRGKEALFSGRDLGSHPEAMAFYRKVTQGNNGKKLYKYSPDANGEADLSSTLQLSKGNNELTNFTYDEQNNSNSEP